MRYLLTGCLLALLCVAGWGQADVIAEIKEKLADRRLSDTTRMQLYDDLSWETRASSKQESMDAVENYYRIATGIGVPSRDFLKYSRYGVIFTIHGPPDSAVYYYDLAINTLYAQHSDNIGRRVAVESNKAALQLYMGDVDGAIISFKKLRDQGVIENDSVLQLNGLVNLGAAYVQGGMPDSAAGYMMEAYRMATELQDSTKLVSISNNLCATLVSIDCEKGKYYCNLAIELSDDYDPSGKAVALNGLATCNINQGKLEDARELSHQSLGLTDSPMTIFHSKLNLGNIAQKQGFLDSAGLYFNAAKNLASKHEFLLEEASALEGLSNLALQKGEYRNGKEFSKAAIQIFDTLGVHTTAYLSVWDNYMQSKSRQLEYVNSSELAHYIEQRDRVKKNMQDARLYELETQYQTEKKELQNQQLQTQNQLATAQLQTQRSYLMAGGVGLAAALAIAGLFFYQRREQERLNAALGEQKAQVDKLNGELRHRAVSSLVLASNMLKAQGRNATDAKSRQLLVENESRLRAITTVQRCLNQVAEAVGYDALLTKVMTNLVAGFDRPVRTDIQLVPAVLGTQQKSYIPLIVNELLTNSLKYAFADTEAPQIQMRSKIVGEELHLTYRDNGPGKAATVQGTGLGTGLLETMIRQLDGRCAERNEKGYVFELWVPVGAG